MKYTLSRTVTRETVPGGHERHMATFVIQEEQAIEYHTLHIPCKSRLNYLLVGIYLDFDWDKEDKVEIALEDFDMLKHIFESQQEYKLWKDAWKLFKEKGKDKARKWLMEQTKVLVLRNVIRGK